MRLILGRAGSGKNRFVMDEIKNAASEECRSILLVPEQSSFSYEKRLFFMLGPIRAAFVNVRSFSRLADDILRAAGETSKERLTDAARVVLVRRTLDALSGNITFFRRKSVDSGFCKTMADVIKEFKNAAVTPELLISLAEHTPSRLTSIKLHEMSLIFNEYESLLRNRYEDESDHLSAAADAVSEGYSFSGIKVYIDGFTGFTEPEYRMIENLAAVSGEVIITLLGDENNSDDTGPFSHVRKSAIRLMDIFRQSTGKEPCVVYLAGNKGMSRGISALEKFLAYGKPDTSTDGVFTICAENPYDEVEKAAAEITELVRNSGYRYSDISVITRDIERYRTVIKRVFRLFDIPYFPDWTRNESFSAPAAFIRASLSLLADMNTENLLALLKTTLTSLSETEISAFENYLYIWDISDKSELTAPFFRDPDGFSESSQKISETKLRQIEDTRLTVIGWVSEFIKKTENQNADVVMREIYFLMKRCGAAAALAERGESQRAFSLLEQLHHILSGDRLHPSDIADVAEVLFSETRVGDIPDTLEQVQVGAADRIRTNDPKVVFVIGLCEGLFPRNDFELPLLSLSERDFINENGGRLSRCFDYLSAMEELHFYNALTCASERVYLGFPVESVMGELFEKPGKLSEYIEIFSPSSSPAEDIRFSHIVNQATAKKACLEDKFVKTEILNSDFFNLAERIKTAENIPEYRLSHSLLQKNFDGSIIFSPTQIENYMNCGFSYFLRYILLIKPIEQAKMSPLQSGSFIHAVIEDVFSKTKGNLTEVTDSQLRSLCDEASDKYINELFRESVRMPARTEYQISRLKKQAVRLAVYLSKEQRQSFFITTDVELPIGSRNGIEPRALMLPTGETVSVSGRIDRVDVAEINGSKYIRILDYKTGIKSFSLDDVFYGLNTQMLIYLFTLIENGASRYGENLIPAGVLYMPSDPPLPGIEEEKGPVRDAYRMDGLVLRDVNVVRAMEDEGNGRYIPVSIGKSGNLSPPGKLVDLAQMDRIKNHIDRIILDMTASLDKGDISALPTVTGDVSCCGYCPYTAVCRRDRLVSECKVEKGIGIRSFKGGDTDD